MPLPMPVCVEVKANKIYQWCGCGESKNLPFCDNKEGCNQSISYQLPYDDTVLFCNCRKSQSAPLCDGSHAELLIAMAKAKRG